MKLRIDRIEHRFRFEIYMRGTPQPIETSNHCAHHKTFLHKQILQQFIPYSNQSMQWQWQMEMPMSQ